MAEKRMFTKKITQSDSFLNMPMSTQCLYFHLNMMADDDGFVNNPKMIARMIGAGEDDLKLLIAKSFVLVFETGVIVIKHWRMHNTIQKDRYHPTDYSEEFKMLSLKDNKSYTFHQENLLETDCIQNGYSLDTEIRLDKNRLDKNSIDIISEPQKTKRFVKPTVDEIRAYCKERKNGVNPERFFDYYEARGWKLSRDTMKDWKATVRTWERNDTKQQPKKDLPEWFENTQTTKADEQTVQMALDIQKQLKGDLR